MTQFRLQSELPGTSGGLSRTIASRARPLQVRQWQPDEISAEVYRIGLEVHQPGARRGGVRREVRPIVEEGPRCPVGAESGVGRAPRRAIARRAAARGDRRGAVPRTMEPIVGLPLG